MGRDWRLSIPTCISQQSAFRMVIKISSGSFICTDELKILQPKRSVLSCSICRASDRDLLLSRWSRWEIQLHLLRRKDRVCDACSPPSRPPPTSSLHSKEEFVQLCSYWLYSYHCAKKTKESLISSSFLLFLGRGVLQREAWILKLSFDGSFSWGLSNLLFFIALFLFPPRVFSSHLQETCSFTSVLLHYLLHLWKTGQVFFNSHHDNFETNRAVMLC